MKFDTYADLRIKGEILDSLRDTDWAPHLLRKKSKDLEKVYGELEQQLGRPATDDEVCEEMDTTLEKFYELVDQIKGLSLGSLQELSTQDDEVGKVPLVRYIPDAPQMDPFFIFHKSEIQSILGAAIDTLPKKERLVVSLYYYDELNMEEIGKVLGVNDTRISQIHTKAMIRMRAKLGKMDGQD